MKNYEFKGWDWTELVPVIGMEEELQKLDAVDPNEHDKAEDAFGKRMAEKIRSYSHQHTEEETKEFVTHLRTFLQKIVEWETKHSYYAPFYQGILNMEDNDSFLQVYARNLRGMWT